MIWFVPSATAATLAVLPLDGRGVDAAAADLATETLRDALVADGRYEIPRASALGTALTTGHEADLRKARDRYAAARAAMDKGDAKAAATALHECLALHASSRSNWSRRDELADVRWLLAAADLKLGDTLQARADLTLLAELWPGYATLRAHSTGTAAKMLAEIEGGLAKSPWSPPLPDRVDELFRALAPEALVLGEIDGTGMVDLRVYDREGNDTEVKGLVPLPVDALGTEWNDLAARVVLAAAGGAAAPLAAAPAREDWEDPAPDPDLDTPAPTATAPRKPAPEPVIREVRIRESGGIRYDDRPITARWWFWVSLVGVVGGASAAGWALSRPAEVITTREEAEWSLSVASP